MTKPTRNITPLYVHLSDDAQTALVDLMQHKQETKTAVIERLLIQAAARISKKECKR